MRSATRSRFANRNVLLPDYAQALEIPVGLINVSAIHKQQSFRKYHVAIWDLSVNIARK